MIDQPQYRGKIRVLLKRFASMQNELHNLTEFIGKIPENEIPQAIIIFRDEVEQSPDISEDFKLVLTMLFDGFVANPLDSNMSHFIR